MYPKTLLSSNRFSVLRHLFEETNANIPQASHPRGVAEEVGVGFEGVGVGHAGDIVDDVGKAIGGVIKFGFIRMEDAGDFL